MSGAESYTSNLEQRRPLSPHLFIYRPMLTMMMSIMHRITGAALYVGTALLAWYLIALASGPKAFAPAAWFLHSIIGELILFGFSFVHPLRETLAQATLIGGLVLTILVWGIYFFL
jgi:succinate dehydrogenase / fumarate reductase cytochrome b subunit